MTAHDIAELNQRVGIPGTVTIGRGADEQVWVEVTNRLAEAKIALQGAHLLAWAPHGMAPVIWLSEQAKFAAGKAIRGGVPICWPWFGPHPTAASLPAHGFARTAPWDLHTSASLPNGATYLSFRLMHTAQSHPQWPGVAELELRVIIGQALEMELVTRNPGPQPLVISAALHTYFAVSDVRRVQLRGLDGCEYLDQVSGEVLQQVGPVTIDGEVDRIYLDSTADCLLDDPGLQRRIRIRKRGSRTTVVWNPWIAKAAKLGDVGPEGYLRMLCVETTNAAHDVVTVAAGSAHHLWASYAVEALN